MVTKNPFGRGPDTVAQQPGPYDLVVVIEATTRCNLACGFCAHDRRLPTERRVLGEDVLRRLLALLGEHARLSGERVLVSWLGGEPLLYRALRLLTVEARRRTGLHFSATTNGTALPQARVLDHIATHYAELTVSIDGAAARHDALRGRIGVHAAVCAGVEGLLARAPGFAVRANVVLMRDNFDEFPALCWELAGWGIREITFNPLGGRDRPEFHASNRLTVEQAMRLPVMVNDIAGALHGRGVRLASSDGYFRRILASARDEPLPVRDCSPGQRYLFVSARGRIAPCSFTVGEYGRVLSDFNRVEDFADLRCRFRAAQAAGPAPACADCPCTNVHGKFL